MSPKYKTTVEPRFSDFDLQGILSSKQYLDLVSEARMDQMKRCYGIPMETYTAKGQTFVLRSFEIEYKIPIFFGSSFDIETWVEEMKGPVAVIYFRFLNSDESVVYSTGVVKYFLVDLKSKKPANFLEEHVQVYLGRDKSS